MSGEHASPYCGPWVQVGGECGQIGRIGIHVVAVTRLGVQYIEAQLPSPKNPFGTADRFPDGQQVGREQHGGERQRDGEHETILLQIR